MKRLIKYFLKYICKVTDSYTYLDDQRTLDELDRLFPPLVVTPTTTKEEVMFNAGQRDIINHINHKLNKRR